VAPPFESWTGESGTRESGTEVVAAIASGPDLAAAALRCWDAGHAILPINPAFTRIEIAALIARLRPTRVDGERNPDGIAAPHGIAAVVVTSGTAGAPKGVELTRAGLEAMGRAYSAGVGASAQDRWLACLPLHHVASLGALARSYVTGIPITVHDGFDRDRVARSPRTEGTTIVSLVPTTIHRLLEAGAPLHEFRVVISGGAPCPPALRARAEAAGVNVVDAYGLSETWSGVALDGVPIAGADIRIGPDDEVLIRGPMVMHGYRLDRALTATVLDPDRTFHTGDVGRFDGGRLRIVDRLKDLVITGGVNVSPTELEGVLVHHPAIADACVIGAPDEEWGERVVAFVVLHQGARAPTVAELRAFAGEQLSAPKLPREVRIVDAIPRTGSGKPLRRVLRGGIAP
jgi:O-succinylbenzoic acid--CoA ligase